MDFGNDELAATRSLVFDAILHQTRQPLFAIQNYLFAVEKLAHRTDDADDFKQMQICVAEMQTAVETLRHSLSKIAVAATTNEANAATLVLSNFLEEAFQIVRICARRRNVRIHVETAAIPPTLIVLAPNALQLVLVHWVLEECPTEAMGTEGEPNLHLSVRQDEGGLAIVSRQSKLERTLNISQYVSK